jgi:hypothetical protein
MATQSAFGDFHINSVRYFSGKVAKETGRSGSNSVAVRWRCCGFAREGGDEGLVEVMEMPAATQVEQNSLA